MSRHEYPAPRPLERSPGQMIARLVSLGIEAGPGRCLPGVKYLRFCVGPAEASWEGLIPVTDWLGDALPALAGISSGALDEAAILSLADRLPVASCLQIPGLPGSPCRVLGLDAGNGQELPRSGQVLLTRIAPSLIPDAGQGLPERMPARWVWSLGNTQLPLTRLSRLAPGDVVLILAPNALLKIDGRPLFGFAFDDKEITMQQRCESSFALDMPVSADSPLTTIPVTLDFVLHQETRTLGDVQSLKEGQVLPLPERAEQSVELSVNGCCIAKGELVDIQGRLGVQITAIGSGARDA